MSEGNEAAIEPSLPIVDSHHHLWVQDNERYLFDEFLQDLNTGHTVIATVYVECGAMYRSRGPAELRPLGEAEFAAGVAAMSESGLFGPTHVCAGFIGAADLRLAEAAGDVIDALGDASGGRLRGIRCSAAWDASPEVNTGRRAFGPPRLLHDPHFRRGFAQLAKRGLTYDAFQYHPQMADVIDLADFFPDTPIVLNHVGGLLRIGPYAETDIFPAWLSDIKRLAQRPNAFVKLGGLGARRCGFDFHRRETPVNSDEIAHAWGPYILACIDAFGPERCMFESNFPPDKHSVSYVALWNAFKKITKDFSSTEIASMFCDTARRVYRLD